MDDTIHFLSQYQRYITEGMPSKEAIAKIFTYTAPALAVTTLLLVVGFGTLTFAKFTPNKEFGILTAVVLSMALLTDLLFLPAILLLKNGKRKNP